MRPIVKYQGGKRRELKTIKSLAPEGITEVVEPFCGGASLSFDLGVQSTLSDTKKDLINLYKVVADGSGFKEIMEYVSSVSKMGVEDLQKLYYSSRSLLNSQDGSEIDRAKAYVTIRQLCFSGMERYNSKGEFNVPFGKYNKFSCSLSEDHHTFLKKCKISCGDFEETVSGASDVSFIFVDPPYLGRASYSSEEDHRLHERLLSSLSGTKAKWILVHSDCDFYRKAYKNFRIEVIGFNYSQRYGKGKDYTGMNVNHLYIMNY